jgi:uncharacterized glyoxalase superfamily protein PhnB
MFVRKAVKQMKVEHVGYSVPEPISMGSWYEENLDFKILRSFGTDDGGAVFLQGPEGNTIIELFKLPEVEALDFEDMAPIQLHLALECAKPVQFCKELAQAGAEVIGEAPKAKHQDKRYLVRDPWGFVLQILNRKDKLIEEDENED